MKMKIVAKNQNVRSTRCAADDAFQKAVEALDQPFQEVLRAVRDLLHVARRELGEDDEAQGDDPGDHHGVGDRKAERPGDLDGLLRQAVFLRLGDCRRVAVRPRVRRRDEAAAGGDEPGAPIRTTAGRPPDPSR